MATPDMAAAGDTSDKRLTRHQSSRHVAKRIRELIMGGAMPVDSLLRTELLAEQLGVHATPVREALMALAGEGMIAFEPRRGFKLIPMRRHDVLALYNVQAYLSGELAARAALTLDDSDFDRLDELQGKLVSAVDANDWTVVEECDFAIHRLINRAASAPRLVSMLSLTLRYVPFSMYGQIKGWELAARDDHAPILRSLRNRSAEGAAEAMRAHIRNAGTIIADHLAAHNFIVAS